MIASIRRWAWLAGLPARLMLIAAIRVYGLTLSGMLGGQCRFHPSCSSYAEAAIRSRGAVLGTALSVWRILRCSPLTRGGIDRPPAPRRRGLEPLEYEAVILQADPSGPGRPRIREAAS